MRVDGILLTSERENILKKDIATLLEELRTGVLKPVEVLEAYQAKSLVVDRDINAVCDYILEARDWALDLENTPVDERRALYGLPISVKVYSIDARMGHVMSHTRSVSMWPAMTAPSALPSASGGPSQLTAALCLG